MFASVSEVSLQTRAAGAYLNFPLIFFFIFFPVFHPVLFAPYDAFIYPIAAVYVVLMSFNAAVSVVFAIPFV